MIDIALGLVIIFGMSLLFIRCTANASRVLKGDRTPSAIAWTILLILFSVYGAYRWWLFLTN
jgi:hypothetical protein